jgi:hypothetical protein
MHNRAATSRLSEDCDAVLVASEQMDVLLNPFESEALVVKADVGCSSLSLERRAGLPSECTKAVVQGYEDYVAICGVARSRNEPGRIIVLVSAWVMSVMLLTELELVLTSVTATVDPDKNRSTVALSCLGQNILGHEDI